MVRMRSLLSDHDKDNNGAEGQAETVREQLYYRRQRSDDTLSTSRYTEISGIGVSGAVE